ncbi:hypothetical protein CFO_g4187 [Ceratocystis platani]|uniref:Uncharacterized protein n=1 Tax=Ceratocystis fimbriata f. sp. platani TaxID=88771 RepID=A0A0F8AYQ0_CERFI|nr:hypothetical protein CFO_g4187 [Ceratocystis platani]
MSITTITTTIEARIIGIGTKGLAKNIPVAPESHRRRLESRLTSHSMAIILEKAQALATTPTVAAREIATCRWTNITTTNINTDINTSTATSTSIITSMITSTRSHSNIATPRINLEDLPNMSPSVGDFGKPSVAMIEALENFYGNGNGRHADGSGNGSWNGTGKKYNNDGLNDTNMGNSENGSTENRAVRKGRSLYNSRHIKLPLLHAPSTCEMDSFLLPLLNMSDQCQPTQIEIAALLAPSIVSYNSLRVKLDPFSTALAEIMLLAEPPAGERVPERVAVMYTAFLLIRYMVNATTENFGCVPEFLKPLEDQLERTHAVWIDFIPFPHARIKLIADSSREGVGNDGGNSNGNDGNGNGDEGRTTGDDSSSVRGAEPPRPFFIKYFACLSINWPYQDSDVLLVANGSDAGSRELMINPVFEAHIRKLENWSVSRDFLDTFPEFEHLINLQEN